MRVLLIGGSGQVGRALLSNQPAHIKCHAPSSSELNLCRPEQIHQQVQYWKPDLIINTAAYTAVDQAECEPEQAFAINSQGVSHLASATRAAQARLFQLSTDYVFDGQATHPYRESDPCHPLGVYGASKLAGEQAALTLGKAALVLRTSWVFGFHGSNFVKTMLHIAAARPTLGIINDQYGGPTPADAIAATLWQLADQPAAHGVFHYSGAPACSWYQFAEQIFSDAQACGLLPEIPTLTPLTSAEYPTTARRPACSALDCSRLETQCDIAAPQWRPALRALLDELVRATTQA